MASRQCPLTVLSHFSLSFLDQIPFKRLRAALSAGGATWSLGDPSSSQGGP